MYRKDNKKEFFTLKAKKEGYPARSVYKLAEIDRKYRVIKKGDRVLDLGCAPGSWLLYVADKVGDHGLVVGVDIQDLNILPRKNIIFVQKDIADLQVSDLRKISKKYHIAVSDLAPSTSGIKIVDTERSLVLCEKAFEIAQSILLPGGNFICKIFEGGSSDDFFRKIKGRFKFAKRFKPKAVLKDSKELYIIAKGFTL